MSKALLRIFLDRDRLNSECNLVGNIVEHYFHSLVRSRSALSWCMRDAAETEVTG
jgi:hypothetical protein